MNRILKRPMFKMGGSSGTGITSGLDRQNYQLGSRPNIRQISGPDRPRFQIPRVAGGADARGFIGSRMMAQPMDTNQAIAAAAPTLSTRERLTQALGAGSNRNMGQFLTQFGLNLLSQSPTGNIFQTAATAAQEPTQGLFDQLNREQDLKRQIALEAERMDIGQEQARELQMLKNLSSDEKNAIEQEIQARMKMGETREVAERIVLDRRAYGVLSEPGEERKKLIEDYVQKGLSEPGVTLSDEPVIRRQATFLADRSRIEKDNDINFGVNPFIESGNPYESGKVYYNAELDKFQIFNGSEANPPFEDIDIRR
jgi:hypothetical protein